MFRLNEEFGIVTQDFEYLECWGYKPRIGNTIFDTDVDPFCRCDGDRCKCLDLPWFSGRLGTGDPNAKRF